MKRVRIETNAQTSAKSKTITKALRKLIAHAHKKTQHYSYECRHRYFDERMHANKLMAKTYSNIIMSRMAHVIVATLILTDIATPHNPDAPKVCVDKLCEIFHL